MENLERLTDLSLAHLALLKQIELGYPGRVNRLLLNQFVEDSLVEAANEGPT